jgi:glycosyltransferase involved in cell wall biosynthesis
MDGQGTDREPAQDGRGRGRDAGGVPPVPPIEGTGEADLEDASPGFLGFLDRMLRPQEEKIRRSVPRAGGCCNESKPVYVDSPAVLWTGIFGGYSGYAKANREILLRLANTLNVVPQHGINPTWSNPYEEMRIEALGRFRVPEGTPHVRFLTPERKEILPRTHRILYTMMETEIVHPEMIDRMNQNYDEIWTPTQWNAATFQNSGLEVPIQVVPLGVNPRIYAPGPKGVMPLGMLRTTGLANTVEVPSGFVFLSVFTPSFRKGTLQLLRAFEDAFSDDPEAGLILATTHCDPAKLPMPDPTSKAKVWVVEGRFTERDMANLYRSCDAYVSASLGEGWNLPYLEAAACGLPVIAPRNSSHPEIFGSDGFLFETDGFAEVPGSMSESAWFEGMPFSYLGPKAHASLVDVLRHVRACGPDVKAQTMRLPVRAHVDYSWEKSLDKIVPRLLELQP